uniref:Uncharacterized protein n=1 Tax=Romanomermis culicivorax TaxID=13658 RepID=A0A915IJS7_ROMCU
MIDVFYLVLSSSANFSNVTHCLLDSMNFLRHVTRFVEHDRLKYYIINATYVQKLQNNSSLGESMSLITNMISEILKKQIFTSHIISYIMATQFARQKQHLSSNQDLQRQQNQQNCRLRTFGCTEIVHE